MSEGPIGKDYFIGYFKESEKEKSRWKIGLEHEVVGFDQKSKKRLDYEGGLKKVLEYFALEHQWEPVFEKDNLISLNKNNSTITMEPGGQLELSCVALSEIRQIEELMNLYQNQLQEFSRREKVAWYSVGFDPVTPVDEIPWMPKQRYRIMRNYLPQFGLGVNHMMKSSCTVQSNFDYSSEDDMIQKFRVTNAFSPVISLLFQSSPFQNGKPSGYKSTRNWAWRHTDSSRCGYLDWVFDSDFGYAKYIEYLFKVPMLLLERDGEQIDARGIDFHSFLEGGLGDLRFEPQDWKTQIGGMFPVSRLRNAIETRTCDANEPRMLLAQAAFWKGLLYDDEALGHSNRLIQEYKRENFLDLHHNGFTLGWDYQPKDYSVAELVAKVLKISNEGLKKIDHRDLTSDATYLEPLWEALDAKMSLSDHLLKAYQSNKNLFELLERFNLHFA